MVTKEYSALQVVLNSLKGKWLLYLSEFCVFLTSLKLCVALLEQIIVHTPSTSIISQGNHSAFLLTNCQHHIICFASFLCNLRKSKCFQCNTLEWEAFPCLAFYRNKVYSMRILPFSPWYNLKSLGWLNVKGRHKIGEDSGTVWQKLLKNIPRW